MSETWYNHRPGVDGEWAVVFSFSRPRPRATQAERWGATRMKALATALIVLFFLRLGGAQTPATNGVTASGMLYLTSRSNSFSISNAVKSAIKKAVIPAAVMALVAAPIFGTPEAITSIILSLAGFISAMVVVVAFWRLTPVASWARWNQRLATWLVAACGAAAGCCVMLAPVIFRR